MSFSESNSDEIQRLYGRITSADNNARRAYGLAEQVDKKFTGFKSEMGELTLELRNFTNEVKRLAVLTESRHQAHVLGTGIERDFGACVQVRRQVESFLQAMDDPAARRECLALAEQAIALTRRDYWLASAAPALAAWLDDDRALAEERLADALRADSRRTSLFFCLALGRLGRTQAASAWLKRYFATLDPAALEPEAVALFSAIDNGFFGAEGWTVFAEAARGWTAAMRSAGAGDEEALAAWTDFLANLRQTRDDDCFPLLRQHSSTWPQIAECLASVDLQTGLSRFFTDMTSGHGDLAENRSCLDPRPALLASLIGEYSPTELPRRRDLRLCQLVIEECGDSEKARERLAREWLKTGDPVPFSRYLSSSFMAGACSDPWRLLLLGIAKPWVEDSLKRLDEANRSHTPADIAITLGEWTGRTAGGDNLSELMASLSGFYAEPVKQLTDNQLPAWLDEKLGLVIIVGVLFSIMTITTVVIPLACLGGLGWYIHKKMGETERDKVAQTADREEKRRVFSASLPAILEEVRRFRLEIVKANREFDAARALVADLRPEQVSPPPRAPHSSDAESAASLAIGAALPAWDIVPPANPLLDA